MEKFWKRATYVVVACVITWWGCGFERTNIEDIHNCIIINQYCGFDNLDAGYYIVKDLKNGKVHRIDVDIRECNVYKVNDTIH